MQKLPNSLKALFPIFILILATVACYQDCMGTTFWVEGYVLDASNNPIPNATIRAWDDGEFDHKTTSNETGYFKTDSAFSYGCFAFEIKISAHGYKSQTLTYYPPSEGFDDELPTMLTIQLEEE